MSDLKDLYQEVILDHNRNPRNFGRLEGANHRAEGHNPLCGDRLTVYADLEGDRIADLKFEGSGCAISKASASIMTTELKQKSTAEANAIFEQVPPHGDGRSPGVGSGVARQARGVFRGSRISGAREVREPAVAHAAGGAAILVGGSRAGFDGRVVPQSFSRSLHATIAKLMAPTAIGSKARLSRSI